MRFRLTRPALAAAALVALLAADGRAQTPPANTDQVEEDWQVVIATPDPTGVGPQLSTAMSPVADGSTPSFVFDLNYQDYPTFTSGGMQAQVWDGDQLLSASSRGSGSLATTGETITWTQRMKIASGTVTFAVDSGRSTTWGKFGQGQQLNVGTSFTTTLNSLKNYRVTTSVAASGVGWEPNRVTSMTLLKVRYYAGGKLLSTDNTARPVDLTN
jgi:hypothetical protein